MVLLVNVVAVLAMPPALVFLFMLANDREVMGDLVSPLWANILATCVVVFLTFAGILFGISVIAPKAFAFLGGDGNQKCSSVLGDCGKSRHNF